MRDDVQIKRFELPEQEALLSFLRVVYSDNERQGDRRFWEWHFLKNPYVSPDEIPIWIAKEAERIVGQLAAIPVRLKIAGVETPAIWILDFMVHSDYRGRGLGKRLVRAAQDFCPVSLGVNTEEQHAPRLLKSLGWIIVGKIHRYYKLLFPGDALREISRFKVLRRLINTSYAPLRSRIVTRSLSAIGTLRSVTRFDSSFDTLWQESSVQWSCAVVRDRRLLDWQYTQQPDKRFDVLGLYKHDKLLGYIVLFFRKQDSTGALPKAAITDLCYLPDNRTEIVNRLLEGGLQVALERRAAGLVTDIIDPFVEERLQRLGFWRVKSPLQLMAKSTNDLGLLSDSRNWFLTRGDSDISIFEDPNL